MQIVQELVTSFTCWSQSRLRFGIHLWSFQINTRQSTIFSRLSYYFKKYLYFCMILEGTYFFSVSRIDIDGVSRFIFVKHVHDIDKSVTKNQREGLLRNIDVRTHPLQKIDECIDIRCRSLESWIDHGRIRNSIYPQISFHKAKAWIPRVQIIINT